MERVHFTHLPYPHCCLGFSNVPRNVNDYNICTRRRQYVIFSDLVRMAGKEMGQTELEARHIIFVGHVQQVGFRYTARRIAQGLGLAGYVRNLPDGTVEMFVQGRAADLDLCLAEIERQFSGYIQDRTINPTTPDPRYKDFQILY